MVGWKSGVCTGLFHQVNTKKTKVNLCVLKIIYAVIFRKATRQLVDSWLISHANSGNSELPSPIHGNAPNNSSRAGSGATTPVRLIELNFSYEISLNLQLIFFTCNRKISAHEFERGGLLKPIVNTIDGTPTFLSISSQNEMVSGSGSNPINSTSSHPHRPQRLSRNELRHLDEKQLIFELVRYHIGVSSCSFPLFD